ncbi:MAG: alpha/beta fold hydrolase [Myxococcota bacterium]
MAPKLPARLWSDAQAEALDRFVMARVAEFTGGLSPVDIVNAWVDWGGHMALSPGKGAAMAESAIRKSLRLANLTLRSVRGEEVPAPPGFRTLDPGWTRFPFATYTHGHALLREWMLELTQGVRGLSPKHASLLAHMFTQAIDGMSPANFPWSHPAVLRATREQKGRNLARGFVHALRDGRRKPQQKTFEVGRDVAVTPGRVVFRNSLIELIQYAPSTDEVRAEPVLIVPAWIMKYYILDLEPANSLVRYLVEQGKTVFVVSWKNPEEADRHVSMDDYLKNGVLAAMDAIADLVPDTQIHAVGYCLGGTLLSIAAAYLAREGDDRLKTLSLLAAQMDFRDAGEVRVFLTEASLALLEARMERRGFLDIASMAGAFQSLRVSDLLFEPATQRYLLGTEPRMNALIAWNEDGTRLPQRMHSEYLRRCYLNNDLAESRYPVNGEPISMADIRVPTFVVATESDHVAPWRSVYKAHHLLRNELTFLLTSGGHNAGIVSGPEHPRRAYRVATRQPKHTYRGPDRWLAETPRKPGSWWSTWEQWIDSQSSTPVPARKPPPGVGAAPGEYVHH